MLIIPSIDLQQGRCVRLRQGDFEQVSVYEASPQELATQYATLGAKRLHIVDLDGAKKGAPQQLPLIHKMSSCGIPIQAGGGIRDLSHAKDLLTAGVSQLVIGSISVTEPELVLQILAELQPEQVILALDVSVDEGIPKIAIHGWQTATQSSLWDVVAFFQNAGIRGILCTNIAMDGMMNGPDLSLYQEAITRFPDLAWQASGGIRNLADLDALSSLGLSAAIVGRALYESDVEPAAWFQSW